MIEEITKKIYLNRYKTSKNIFKRLYYHIQSSKLKKVFYKIIDELDDFITHNNVIEMHTLLEYVSLCQMLNYKKHEFDGGSIQCSILGTELAQYAKITASYNDIRINFSIRMVDPIAIEIDYYEKETCYHYTVTRYTFSLLNDNCSSQTKDRIRNAFLILGLGINYSLYQMIDEV